MEPSFEKLLVALADGEVRFLLGNVRSEPF